MPSTEHFRKHFIKSSTYTSAGRLPAKKSADGTLDLTSSISGESAVASESQHRLDSGKEVQHRGPRPPLPLLPLNSTCRLRTSSVRLRPSARVHQKKKKKTSSGIRSSRARDSAMGSSRRGNAVPSTWFRRKRDLRASEDRRSDFFATNEILS